MDGNSSTSRLCVFCGYDTTGVAAAGTFACPECGKHLDAVHGPFLKGPVAGKKHLIAISIPALVAAGVISLEFALLAACMALRSTQDLIQEIAPLLALILAFLMLTTFAIGLGYTFRTTDSIKSAYVPRRLHERWWWYNLAVLSAFVLIVAMTILAIVIVALTLIF